MKEYVFEDIEVGTKCEFEVKITPDKMQKFMEITGDENPLHMDEAFARSRGYEGKVVYGMLTASLMSKVAGMYLPGKNSLIHSMEGKFIKPVYINEELVVTGRVAGKEELFNVINVTVICLNADKEKVFKGKMKVGIFNEES